jgi:hypothetical protein
MYVGGNMSEIIKKIQGLQGLSMRELQEEYCAVFNSCSDKKPAANKANLIKQIAYKLQEQAYGGLSEQAVLGIKQLAAKYDPLAEMLNKSKKKVLAKAVAGGAESIKPGRNPKIPLPGTTISKNYKGETLEIKVLPDGFEYKNRTYKSLSKIAKEITGGHISGYAFFKL